MTPAFQKLMMKAITVKDFRLAQPDDAWLVADLRLTVVSTKQQGGPVLRFDLVDGKGDVLMSFDTRQVPEGAHFCISPVAVPFNLAEGATS